MMLTVWKFPWPSGGIPRTRGLFCGKAECPTEVLHHSPAGHGVGASKQPGAREVVYWEHLNRGDRCPQGTPRPWEAWWSPSPGTAVAMVRSPETLRPQISSCPQPFTHTGFPEPSPNLVQGSRGAEQDRLTMGESREGQGAPTGAWGPGQEAGKGPSSHRGKVLGVRQHDRLLVRGPGSTNPAHTQPPLHRSPLPLHGGSGLRLGLSWAASCTGGKSLPGLPDHGSQFVENLWQCLNLESAATKQASEGLRAPWQRSAGLGGGVSSPSLRAPHQDWGGGGWALEGQATAPLAVRLPGECWVHGNDKAPHGLLVPPPKPTTQSKGSWG